MNVRKDALKDLVTRFDNNITCLLYTSGGCGGKLVKLYKKAVVFSVVHTRHNAFNTVVTYKFGSNLWCVIRKHHGHICKMCIRDRHYTVLMV